MQRRIFLKSGAFALVTMGLSPSFLRRTVFAADLPSATKGKVLICLFQRGAADALNVGHAQLFKRNDVALFAHSAIRDEGSKNVILPREPLLCTTT